MSEMLFAAITGEDAVVGIGAVLLVVWKILYWIFCILLVLAPLKIWKWTKRSCLAIEQLNSTLNAVYSESRKNAKETKQYLIAINNHLASIDNSIQVTDDGDSMPD